MKMHQISNRLKCDKKIENLNFSCKTKIVMKIDQTLTNWAINICDCIELRITLFKFHFQYSTFIGIQKHEKLNERNPLKWIRR